MHSKTGNGFFPGYFGLSLGAFSPLTFSLMTNSFDSPDEPLADQAIDWLVLLRSGSVSADTQQEFDAWLQQDAAHRQAFKEAEALWGSAAKVLAAAPPQLPEIELVTPLVLKPRRLWQGVLPLAASVLLGLWLSWALWADVWLSDYATGVGEQRQVTLADGSLVWLNTNTAISVAWSAERRRITLLKGQAEFKVAKDAQRPFEVSAGPTLIKALGTAFEVFEQAEGAVDITVSEHAVGVRFADQAEESAVRVEEGERLHYAGQGALSSPEAVSLNQSKAWQRGKLIFKDQALPDVIAELNRYSKAKIVLQGKALQHYRVSGVFPLDDQAVVAGLEKAFPLHATRLGPWLVILHA